MRLFSCVGALLVLGFFTPAAIHAQCDPAQSARLVPSANVGQGEYGYATAISRDGNTIIVGAPFDNMSMPTAVGAVYVYNRSGTTWVQQGPKLIPTGAAGLSNFGVSVALSADGNTAAIGATNDNAGPSASVGAVFIFTRTGNTWTQQGTKLVPTGGINGAFGNSVALSADGNTLAVGAASDSNYLGAAYFFTRSGSTWSQQGSKVVDPDGGSFFDQFGRGVALSADGNTAVITSQSSNVGAPAAFILTRSAGIWSFQGPRILPSSTAGGVGRGVALSADGNTLLVGAWADGTSGAAYVFARTGATWSQQARLLPGGAGADAYFGFSVALSADGNTALIGAHLDGSGSAWCFTRTSTAWSQQGDKLTPTGAIGASQFGYGVGLSGDGITALVGASYDNNRVGAAYTFARPAAFITQQPVNRAVSAGASTSFSVAAVSGSSITYRWRRNAVPLSNGPTPTGAVISGATSPQLSIASVAAADNATIYDCLISTSCSALRSDPAILTVSNTCRADVASLGGNPIPDGIITADDLIAYLAAFFAGCP